MRVSTMRTIDRWLGVPTCFVLTLLRRWSPLRPKQGAGSKSTVDGAERQGDLAAGGGGPIRSNHQPPTPTRWLFIKLAEQGSTVLAHAALRRAVEKVGRENVFFLVFEENRFILDALDILPEDNVIAIKATSLWGAIRGALGAIRRLRRLDFDAAIDLEFFARSSAALAILSGARRRAGFHPFHGEASYRGDLFTHRLSFNPHLHTSMTFLSLVESLDHPARLFPQLDWVPPAATGHLPVFHSTADEKQQGLTILRESFGADWKPLVLLNANASDLLPLRRWADERYVELARRLLESDAELRVGFTGAPDEASAIRRLVEQVASERCRLLAGKTTLRELLAIYSLAEVLVTNDSGPAHFASMTPIDVIVLFGPETPRLFAAPSPRTHPLWAGLACSPCVSAYNDRQSSCRENVCMNHLTVDMVLEKTRELLQRRRGLSLADTSSAP